MLVSSPAPALHTPLFENDSKQWKVDDDRLNLDLRFDHSASLGMTNVVTTTSSVAANDEPCCQLITEPVGGGTLIKNLNNNLALEKLEQNLVVDVGEDSPSLMSSILQELEKNKSESPPAAESAGQSSPAGKKSALSSPSQDPDNKANNEPHAAGQQQPKQALKRVSFGSSKGSMVETLIYDDTCPLDTKPADHVDHAINETTDAVTDYRQRHRRPVAFHKMHSSSLAASEITESQYERASLAEDGSDEAEAERSLSKVRVTFYESQKPLTISSPDPPSNPFRVHDEILDQTYIHSGVELSNMVVGDLRDGSARFDQALAAEEGSENPFRPDGELSKEADAIVERIKYGKPLTPTRSTDEVDARDNGPVSNNASGHEEAVTASTAAATSAASPGTPTTRHGDAEKISRMDAASSQQSTPRKPQSPVDGPNGRTPDQPTSVEVQRSVVGSPSQQVERVVIKKTKSKKSCCVIQ